MSHCARLFFIFTAAISMSLLMGCASPLKGSGSSARAGDVYHGIACWYGKPYHGRRTASGEVFNMHAMTAAHRELPFGTLVRVTHLGNGRSVDVRINDRGPFKNKRQRIIDLSMGAAEKLRMKNEGLAKVKLVILKLPAKRD